MGEFEVFSRVSMSLFAKLEFTLYNLRYLSFESSCRVSSILLTEFFPLKFFTNFEKNVIYFLPLFLS